MVHCLKSKWWWVGSELPMALLSSEQVLLLKIKDLHIGCYCTDVASSVNGLPSKRTSLSSMISHFDHVAFTWSVFVLENFTSNLQESLEINWSFIHHSKNHPNSAAHVPNQWSTSGVQLDHDQKPGHGKSKCQAVSTHNTSKCEESFQNNQY